MAKRKTADNETAKPVAQRNTKVATSVADSSPAPASKEAAKTPKKEVVQKPVLETRKVCFTDEKTGKKFCGEMTEVPSKKAPVKVGSTRKRRKR